MPEPYDFQPKVSWWFSVQGESFHAAIRPEQQHVGTPGGEEAVGDHADDAVEACFHGDGVIDHEIEAVDDLVAVVGDHALAIDGIGAELDQFPCHVGARHGDHLDGQWKIP